MPLPGEQQENRGRGRPEFDVTEQRIKEAEILAGRGLTQQQIADYWGISKRTLARKSRENLDFYRALKKGKSKTIAYVTGKLMEKIKEGDKASIFFFLRTQAGWRYADLENTNPSYEEIGDDSEEEQAINTDDPNEASKTYQYIMLKKEVNNERNGSGK